VQSWNQPNRNISPYMENGSHFPLEGQAFNFPMGCRMFLHMLSFTGPCASNLNFSDGIASQEKMQTSDTGLLPGDPDFPQSMSVSDNIGTRGRNSIGS